MPPALAAAPRNCREVLARSAAVRSSRTILAATADRVRDAELGRAAVALHDDAVEPEEDRAVVVVGIEMVAQQLGRRARDQEADLRAQSNCWNARLSRSATKRAVPFDRLQRDVAREAVGHDHVDIAARELVALDEAVEAQRQVGRGAQRCGGIAELVGALHVLGADVEQRTRGALQVRVTMRA